MAVTVLLAEDHQIVRQGLRLLLEREGFDVVGEGKTTKEIAGVLGLSIKTAETHRGRIMRKLGIRETAGLVRYAIRRGLVRP